MNTQYVKLWSKISYKTYSSNHFYSVGTAKSLLNILPLIQKHLQTDFRCI